MPLPPSFADELRQALGAAHVITEPEQLRTYDCDGLTGWRSIPAVVALPGSTEEVQAVVRLCARERLPFVARGAGTGLSGGALPVADGVVISLARMNRILEIDLASQRIVVQPGVANLDVTRAVAADGFFYAPDPSSQQVCTIGGNVAENSGGAHCLKNGFTVNHVTGLVLVLPDGELVELGGKALDPPGVDLLGAFIGSEGTLGIATEITLRILRTPETVTTHLAAFASIDGAGEAVSAIVSAGILPAAIEMMDRLTIVAAEQAFRPGYPPDAEAVLLVELDGVAVQVEEDAAEVDRICRSCGAFEVRVARDDSERALLWLGRKGAFPAMGRMSPDYYVQDGVVPRTKLPEVLRRIGELSQRARAPGRERLPRRGRQPAPARPLRRRQGRDRGREGAGRGDPGRLPRRRRLAHGRARRRRRQGLLDAADVLRARPGDLRSAPPSLRPGRAREPRQGPADTTALRRGARALSRAPARKDRPCRALLASRKPPSSSGPQQPTAARCASARTSMPPGWIACSSTKPAI